MHQNKVLSPQAKTSTNFYESDHILQHVLGRELSEAGRKAMEARLQKLGVQAAGKMNALSLRADKKGPELVKRDFYGETINEIEFDQSYWSLLEIALESGLFSIKWEPKNKVAFKRERHRLGFAAGFLFAMSECGLFCPLCMTDGVARLIELYASEEDKARLLPHIYTEKVSEIFTGAMFLTEKAGGSDVGANLVTATHWKEDLYLLNGEKWFCSNANADLIFVLARTDEKITGTRGLSIFLVEKQLPDGTRNPMNMIRLKDKLGVRSMASAEIVLTDTVGKLIGTAGSGFKIMADMINLSRLYNSVTAVAVNRRAIVEAYQFLSYRKTFGKVALDHALVKDKLQGLIAISTGDFYLTWRAIRALDLADNGHKNEGELLRLLTPMIKKCTAENSVYNVRESMELMGGMGYIEDGVVPKIFRDALVLPIWEGAGNIMVLDMLRAFYKSAGFGLMLEEMKATFEGFEGKTVLLLSAVEALLLVVKEMRELDQAALESSAKPVFERLTDLYRIAVLIQYLDETSRPWIGPTLDYLIADLTPTVLGVRVPLERDLVEGMVAWGKT